MQNGWQPARSRCGALCLRRPFGASCGDIGRCRPLALLGGLLSGPARLLPSSAAFPAQGAPGRRGGGVGRPAALRSCLRRGPGRAGAPRREQEAGACGARLAAPGRLGERLGHRPAPRCRGRTRRAPGRSPRRRWGAAPRGKARAPGARRDSPPSRGPRAAPGRGGGKLALARGSAGSRRGAAGSSPGRGGFSAADAARGGGRPPAEGANLSPGEGGDPATGRVAGPGWAGGDWQRALLAEPPSAGRRRPVACGRGTKRRFLLPVASAPPARPWAGPLAALPAPPGSSEPRENAPAGQTGCGYF